ncbi:hypothetical protein FGRMN_517 [Fusarium graminum]|nr:hypothetical protein FGRMN_517 [Fusarium graminum]
MPESPRIATVLGHREQNNVEESNSTRGKTPVYRSLSPTEWLLFARGVGGLQDAERNVPVHPTSQLWPPKGLPPGLYRDAVYRRTMSSYSFGFASAIRWIILILQLLIGASLTALGGWSAREGDGTPVTVLGASNTVIAGLLALLHNSGVPDRYRYDKAEFERVEDRIRELLDTGLVREDKSVNEVLAECFDCFQHAKRTVNSNIPAAYVASQVTPAAPAVVPALRQPLLQQTMIQATESITPLSPRPQKRLSDDGETETEEAKEPNGPSVKTISK